MEDLLDRLRASGMRGALVGGEGRGKSTLLEELGGRLAGGGYTIHRIALRGGERSLPPGSLLAGRPLAPDAALLLDGAEQLSLSGWWRLRWRARRAGAFVVTTHREGRLPTLLRCETSPALLRDLLDTLAPHRPTTFPSAEELWKRHDGDVRQALFEAYDAWSGRADSDGW